MDKTGKKIGWHERKTKKEAIIKIEECKEVYEEYLSFCKQKKVSVRKIVKDSFSSI